MPKRILAVKKAMSVFVFKETGISCRVESMNSTFIDGYSREEVIILLFNGEMNCPIDNKIRYITRVASSSEKEHVQVDFAIGKTMYEDMRFINTIRSRVGMPKIILDGFHKKELNELYSRIRKDMREKKFPNSSRVMVPLYSLCASEREFIMYNYLSSSVGEIDSFTFHDK